jgi:hypothetical protein
MRVTRFIKLALLGTLGVYLLETVKQAALARAVRRTYRNAHDEMVFNLATLKGNGRHKAERKRRDWVAYIMAGFILFAVVYLAQACMTWVAAH